MGHDFAVHGFNRYAYGNNNPYKYVDPTGQIAESVWDAASLSVGLVSLGNNIAAGNWSAAGMDTIGVIADTAALAIPVVPGGASIAIKAGGVAKDADRTLSRKAAFRQAKEKVGIPKSQQPSNTYHEKIRDQQGHVEGRVYEFKNADGSTATIREHTLGHELGNHGSHFNSELRNAEGIKQSLKNNADSHTYIKQD